MMLNTPALRAVANHCELASAIHRRRFASALFEGAPEAALLTSLVTYAFLLSLIWKVYT